MAAPVRPPYSAQELVQVRMQPEVAVSPDGRSAAFVSDISGALELWTIPAQGGWPSQLTSLGERVHEIEYSPDGAWIYFASDFGGDERPDLYRVPAAGGRSENLTRSDLADRSPALSRDGKRVAFTSDPEARFHLQVLVLDLATGATVQLTREPVNMHEPVWSRDGTIVAATRSGDDQRGELLVLEPGSGRSVEIRPPSAGGIVYAWDFSPDGRDILTVAENARGFRQLALVSAKGGDFRFIGPDVWDVTAARWHEGRGILFTRNEGGRTGLYRLPAPGSEAEALVPPRGVIADFDIDDAGRRLVFLQESSVRPADVWTLDLESGSPAQLTFSFVGGVKPEELSPSRIVRYMSFDGVAIEGLFIAPRHKRLGDPPPVIAHIHGGPDYQAFDDFFPIRQALAEAGFAVFAPNYRGSAGYGRRFLDLNNKDWGGADLRDIIEGVRHLERLGEVDAGRAGITGGSYGGFMTLTALTKSPEFWKAGAEAYGMPDLALDYDLGGKQFSDWYATEMGTPQTHPELFRERSAINYLDRVKAPLIIFQGENDTNVPKIQSENIHAALKARGLESELVVYPEEGHGFTKRKNRLDWIRRTEGFFSRHLGGPAKKGDKP